MVTAMHGFNIPPHSEMTLDGYSCSECDAAFAIGRTIPEGQEPEGVSVPRFCPNCGKQFDRVILFDEGNGKPVAHT